MFSIFEPSRHGRREFLRIGSLALGGLGLSSLPASLGAASPGRKKSVVLLFLQGGPPQIETFDPKPALNKYNGKTVAQIPIPNPLESDLIKNRIELVKGDANGKIYEKLYGMQVGYGKHGKSGIEVSDWWPHLSKHIDDISVICSMWTTASNHDAQL